MTIKIISVLLLSLVLASCSADRNILTQDSGKIIDKKIESPFSGNKNSKVQMMIFTDFQCSACIRFDKIIWWELFEKYVLTNKIGLTYKMFPLSIHKNAPEDALAALCAESKWKYKEFAKEIYSLEEAKAWLRITYEDRLNIGKKIWLDSSEFKKCIDDWNYVSKIKEDMDLWNKMWLQWTPSVYINWKIVNFWSPEELFRIIDLILASGNTK